MSGEHGVKASRCGRDCAVSGMARPHDRPQRRNRLAPAFLKTLVSFFFILAVAIHGASAAQAEATSFYSIGRGDTLRVVVAEEPDLSGEYQVTLAGFISLPGVGDIRCVDLTTSQVQAEIVMRLKAQMQLAPRVSVAISAYRPVYILGDVSAPGSFPYVIGMTTLHMVALAGGYDQNKSAASTNPSNAIRSRKNFNIILNDLWAIQARKARLLAERDERAKIDFPPEFTRLNEAARLAEYVDGERRVFELNRKASANELKVLNNQIRENEDEITTLRGQLAAKRKEEDLINQELKDMQVLLSKGLTPKPRVLALRRAAAKIEGDKLEISSFISRSRQRLNAVKLDIIKVRERRSVEINLDLLGAEHRLGELTERLQAAREDMGWQRSGGAMIQMDAPNAVFDLTITRNLGKGPEDLPADEKSAVLPGDVVVVTVRNNPGAPAGHDVGGKSFQTRQKTVP